MSAVATNTKNQVLFINTDGGSRGNPGPAAIGVHAELAGQVVFEKSSTIGEGTNNTAEYTAVIQALDWLKGWLKPADGSLPHQIQSVQFLLDSQLVVEQLSGRYKIKQPHILNYVRQIRLSIQALAIPVSFSYVPRARNSRADALVNEALDAAVAQVSL